MSLPVFLIVIEFTKVQILDGTQLLDGALEVNCSMVIQLANLSNGQPLSPTVTTNIWVLTIARPTTPNPATQITPSATSPSCYVNAGFRLVSLKFSYFTLN